MYVCVCVCVSINIHESSHLHKDVLTTGLTARCVSSWNDNGYKHMDLHPTRLMRTGFFPGLGWMLRKSLWVGELRDKWPANPTTGWDHWMRVDAQVCSRHSRQTYKADI